MDVNSKEENFLGLYPNYVQELGLRLSPVSLTSMINIKFWISPQIFLHYRNVPNGILTGQVETDFLMSDFCQESQMIPIFLISFAIYVFTVLFALVRTCTLSTLVQRYINKEILNFQGVDSNPIPTRFLAPADCSKIPALALWPFLENRWT